MRHEVDVSKLIRTAHRIRCRHRSRLTEDDLAVRREMLLHALHLGRCIRERFEFSLGLDRIADQQQIPGDCSGRRGARSGKDSNGTRDRHGDIFDPVLESVPARLRSEEHTSELQSHLNLVCRLLLEKKKKNNNSFFFYIKKKKNKKTII